MSNILIPTNRRPTLPGEILREEFLKPLGIAPDAFAQRIGLTRRQLDEMLNGKHCITLETASRLGQVLGTGPEVWTNMQVAVDRYEALYGA
jgi:addiction module HigA family antidote